jgi:hypothetical protein
MPHALDRSEAPIVAELSPFLPAIGSSAFFPALVDFLRNDVSCPPLDPIILRSILLCIIVGDRHLILRTHEADVSNVAKVAAAVSPLSEPVILAVLSLSIHCTEWRRSWAFRLRMTTGKFAVAGYSSHCWARATLFWPDYMPERRLLSNPTRLVADGDGGVLLVIFPAWCDQFLG